MTKRLVMLVKYARARGQQGQMKTATFRLLILEQKNKKRTSNYRSNVRKDGKDENLERTLPAIDLQTRKWGMKSGGREYTNIFLDLGRGI